MRIRLLALAAALSLPAGAALGEGAQRPAAVDAPAPLQIIVSLQEQSLTVYRGNEVVTRSNISSGKPGHDTPTGIFSILHKKKFHRSNIYSNAPMPWMQRLTWTGIALHESDSVPNQPASHGCVRLPNGFAQELYSMTRAGEHVLITGAPAAPRRIAHDALPRPGKGDLLFAAADQWRIRMEAGAEMGDGVATQISTSALLPRDPAQGAGESHQPVRILITRLSQQEVTARLQAALNELGMDAGEVDGIAGPATYAAIRRFQASRGEPETGVITPQLAQAIHSAAGMGELPANGKIHVRQGFEPVFEAAVNIRDSQKPLGTHLLTVTHLDRPNETADWNAVTLENDLSAFHRAYFGISDTEADILPRAEDTLSRIELPDYVKARISRMLTPGSSIAISDTGLGPHTGWKTDFIVITRTGKRA
jgi:peptidoglycan hydrolase-like protein with peptidoglycan-binding domain